MFRHGGYWGQTGSNGCSETAAWYKISEGGLNWSFYEQCQGARIAAALNERDLPTTRGAGTWSAVQVARVTKRLQGAEVSSKRAGHGLRSGARASCAQGQKTKRGRAEESQPNASDWRGGFVRCLGDEIR